MTPERALEILNEYIYGPRAFGKNPGDAALKAILAACAEERREAWNAALWLLTRCEQPAAALAVSLHMTKCCIPIEQEDAK